MVLTRTILDLCFVCVVSGFSTPSSLYDSVRIRGNVRRPLISKRKAHSTRMSAADTEQHEVVIVGGGMGGLYTASKLISSGVEDVVVLESRNHLGGRIKTTRDDDESPMFNDFAWRVSETNTMMIDLAKRLGLNLIPQATPPPDDPEKGHGVCKHGVLCNMGKTKETIEPPARAIPSNRPPLSDFAAASLESAAEADRQDRESGYAGRTAQISFPEESHGNDCFFVEGGMDRYWKELAETLPDGCTRIYHRVADVEKTEDGYRVHVKKTEDGKQFSDLIITCSQLVLATPPYSLRRLKVAQDMLPALMAVHERRLCHGYVKCKPNAQAVPDRSDTPDRIYRMLPDSILQQIISGDYGGGVFQGAYASDRFERVWRELEYQGKETVKEEIKRQLSKISDIKPPPDGWDDSIEEVYVKLGFVHRWHIEAHATGKNKEELSLQAITPNPARLPGLYLVGEAFSPFQGWTEGALWTADKAADIIMKAREYPSGDYAPGTLGRYSEKISLQKDKDGKLSAGEKSPQILVYRGLVIDVDDWYQRHPGGAGPINNHSGEDASNAFDNVHMGCPAPLSTMFALQIGSTDL